MSRSFSGCGRLAGILDLEELPAAREKAVAGMLTRLERRASEGGGRLLSDHHVSLFGSQIDGIWIAADLARFQIEELSAHLPSELAGELLGRASSAEEIIAQLYKCLGEDALQILQGAFALAIYDQNRRQLLLARDPVGQKPLYWTEQGGKFLFASELKALALSNQLLSRLDLEGCAAYLGLGALPQEKTPLSGVYKLLPGHLLRLSVGGEVSVSPYWSYSAVLENPASGHEEISFETIASQALHKHLPDGAQAQVGCLLREEGEGVELLSLLGKEKPGSSVQIYSRLFQKNPTSSSPIPASFHGFIEEPEHLLQQLPETVYLMDEPCADTTAPLMREMARCMREAGLTTALLATGSPDWLASHIERPRVGLHHLLETLTNGAKRYLALPFASLFYRSQIFPLLRSLHTHPWHRAFIQQHALFDTDQLHRLGSPYLHPYDLELLIHKFPCLQKLDASWASLLYLNLKVGLPSRYCLLEDRLIASEGISPLAPFLDRSIVEYVGRHANLPFSQPRKPPPTRRRRKEAPVNPLPSFLTSAPLINAYKKLEYGVLVDNGLLDPRWVRSAITASKNTPLAARQLWALLVFELWMRLFFERDSMNECQKWLSGAALP